MRRKEKKNGYNCSRKGGTIGSSEGPSPRSRGLFLKDLGEVEEEGTSGDTVKGGGIQAREKCCSTREEKRFRSPGDVLFRETHLTDVDRARVEARVYKNGRWRGLMLEAKAGGVGKSGETYPLHYVKSKMDRSASCRVVEGQWDGDWRRSTRSQAALGPFTCREYIRTKHGSKGSGPGRRGGGIPVPRPPCERMSGSRPRFSAAIGFGTPPPGAICVHPGSRRLMGSQPVRGKEKRAGLAVGKGEAKMTCSISSSPQLGHTMKGN